MQSDAWAAYDTLFERHNLGASNDKQISEKKEELLLLLSRFVRRLALTPQEIESLPNNYSLAVTAKQIRAEIRHYEMSRIATNESIHRWLC